MRSGGSDELPRLFPPPRSPRFLRVRPLQVKRMGSFMEDSAKASPGASTKKGAKGDQERSEAVFVGAHAPPPVATRAGQGKGKGKRDDIGEAMLEACMEGVPTFGGFASMPQPIEKGSKVVDLMDQEMALRTALALSAPQNAAGNVALTGATAKFKRNFAEADIAARADGTGEEEDKPAGPTPWPLQVGKKEDKKHG